MKKRIAMLLVLLIIFLLSACGKADTRTVGILMPTDRQISWKTHAESLAAGFTDAGYTAQLLYADNDPAVQAAQIEGMIDRSVDVLVVAAVDGAALTRVCEKARQNGILVIADDCLITGTEAVDFYVAFDPISVGQLQGRYLAEVLDLANQPGPFTLEIFAGPQNDPEAAAFYNGAMQVLKPYIDEGKLVVKSGQVDFTATETASWDSVKAEARMKDLLDSCYAESRLDAVLSAADCLSVGVVSALEAKGYGTDLPFPVITGQDAELTAVRNIRAGKQAMTTVFDGSRMAQVMVPLVTDLLAGREVTPAATYHNGVFDVPALTCEPRLITWENLNDLVELGLYTEAQING